MLNSYQDERLSVQDTIEYLIQNINWDRVSWCNSESLHRALCTKYFNEIILKTMSECSK